MDDDLPKISRNRNNLRFSTIKNEENRVPPLPDVTGIETDRQTSVEKTVTDSRKQRHLTQRVHNSAELSNNENSHEHRNGRCKAMRLKKRKKRLSLEMIRNKSNDILGELFAVNKPSEMFTENRSSDSDCIFLRQDSPIKKPSLLNRKSSLESEPDEDSDFQMGRCSSHKKVKFTDDREINHSSEFDNRKRKNKPKLYHDNEPSSTPTKVCRDNIECKKRLKYCGSATKVKQVPDPDSLTKVRKSSTPGKFSRDNVECKKSLKYCSKVSKAKQDSDSDTLIKVKDTNVRVKEKSIVMCKSEDNRTPGLSNFLSTLKLSKQTQHELKRYPLKKCYVYLSKLQNQLEQWNVMTECKSKNKPPKKYDSEDTNMHKSYCQLTTEIKPINSPHHDDSKSNRLENSYEYHKLLQKCDMELPELDTPITKDLIDSKIVDMPIVKDMETKSIELNSLLKSGEKSISDDVNNNIPFKTSDHLQYKERHFLDIFPTESDIAGESSIEGDPGDSSVNYTLHSSEFSDISDTDDDEPTDPTPVSYTQPIFQKFRQVFSNVYSDISEESDNEIIVNGNSRCSLPLIDNLKKKCKEGVKGNSRCSSPLIENWKNDFKENYKDVNENSSRSYPLIDSRVNDQEEGFKVSPRCSLHVDNQEKENSGRQTDIEPPARNNVSVSSEIKQHPLKQMEEFMANISASNCFSKDDDEMAGEYLNQKKFDRDELILSYIIENTLIKNAFETLKAEAVDTNYILPMEEETLAYADGFPTVKTLFLNNEGENSSEYIEKPMIYIDVDDESDLERSFIMEQCENKQDEKFDTSTGFKEDVKQFGDNTEIEENKYSLMNSLEEESAFLSNIRKIDSCGSQKSCFSNETNNTDCDSNFINLNCKPCVNGEFQLYDEKRTHFHSHDDVKTNLKFSQELPELSTCKSECENERLVLLGEGMKPNSVNSDSPNLTMPCLSSISPYKGDHFQSSSNSALLCHKSVSLQLIASAYASPVTDVVTPVMPVLTPLTTVTSSKHRRRKVRCKHMIKSASKYINFDVPNENVASLIVKKLSLFGRDSDQIHFQLKGYVHSNSTMDKLSLPQSKECLLDVCMADVLMIGDAFFELLSCLLDQYEIPLYTVEFIIQSLWLNAGTCLRQINSARNILKKIAVCDSSAIALSWQQIIVSIEHMFSDLAAISSTEILQVEYYLELVIDVLKNDLYRRNLSDSLEIKQSRAYKLLSPDSYLNIPRSVINYIHQALNMIDNRRTIATFRSKLVKLLYWLQVIAILIGLEKGPSRKLIKSIFERHYGKTNHFKFDQIQHNPGCTATGHDKRCENLDLKRRVVELSI